MRSISTAGHPPRDLLGELDLARGRRAEARAARGGLASTAASTVGVGVAVDQRPPRADVVDVAVAVDVEELRARRPRSMKIGSRPIARIARTGELTPPGSTRRARR